MSDQKREALLEQLCTIDLERRASNATFLAQAAKVRDELLALDAPLESTEPELDELDELDDAEPPPEPAVFVRRHEAVAPAKSKLDPELAGAPVAAVRGKADPAP